MQSSAMIHVIDDDSGGGVVSACRGKARSEHRPVGSGVPGNMSDAEPGYTITAMRMPGMTGRLGTPT